jgi:hypothetical protein
MIAFLLDEDNQVVEFEVGWSLYDRARDNQDVILHLWKRGEITYWETELIE